MFDIKLWRKGGRFGKFVECLKKKVEYGEWSYKRGLTVFNFFRSEGFGEIELFFCKWEVIIRSFILITKSSNIEYVI